MFLSDGALEEASLSMYAIRPCNVTCSSGDTTTDIEAILTRNFSSFYLLQPVSIPGFYRHLRIKPIHGMSVHYHRIIYRGAAFLIIA